MTLRSQFKALVFIVLFGFVCLLPLNSVHAQDYVTGAFEGEVRDSNDNPIPDATVQIINRDTGVPIGLRTDTQGRFRQGLLAPGDYIIRVSHDRYLTSEKTQSLNAMDLHPVIPPIKLTAKTDVVAVTTTPTVTATPAPGQPAPQPSQSPASNTSKTSDDYSIQSDINRTDAQRGGSYTKEEIAILPLGSVTLTRTFDELGLLLPGVAPPPQTLGSVAGPGVGPGVGSAGQFSVNGLRSRANNFTVDGSDNNDEDIGVRRQGFFALVPQPIESIQGYNVVTLLAPAQYGRNMGAQVNAVSKSGGNETHGAFFGFLNSTQLNARDSFDTAGGNRNVPLRAEGKTVFINGVPGVVRLNTGDKDSFTLGQGGLVIGGPLVPETSSRPGRSMFYFLSVEGQLLNANKEVNFAVPTITQRGAFRSGARGLSVNPLTGAAIDEFPTSVSGDAIFSFFPFPNNLNGVYGENTFTQVLPASAQGKVLSGKVDTNFKIGGKQQTLTARYNFTDDWRDIPVVGGALFSRLRPNVRTQNFSTFLNGEITNNVLNQVRLSYGRTRLKFDEGRDNEFLLPVRRSFNNPDDARFLLNTRFLVNNTLPNFCFTVLAPCVNFDTFGTGETETSRLDISGTRLGPVGQINIAGFSPVGVDVFNFPQERVNNTYQLADTVTLRTGNHSVAFGADIRRTELISDLPRNSRPLLTFNGAPRIIFNPVTSSVQFATNVPGALNPLIRPEDFAAAGAPSGVFQSLALPGRDSHINLRYYQWNFFGQDEWRIRRNLSLSFGLRYEYNTPPREAERRIESTFGASLPNLVSGLSTFIDGRTSIFEPDHNNFAPRVGFAYSPHWLGADHTTVIRAGYGMFYDQILGAVVSQSRNVFPTFTTINLGGGCCNVLGTGRDQGFNIFNPLNSNFGPIPLVVPGTLNTLNPALSQNTWLQNIFAFFPSNGTGRPFGATLPNRQFNTPMAHHYSVTVEQQLSRSLVMSASYVGTQGRDLVRLTTPNLGPNYLVVPVSFNPDASSFGGGTFSGITLDPGSLSRSATFTTGRPVNTIGPIFRFESSATSRYDALQVQLRGRYRLLGATQFQANYTFGRVNDDVSDVFDLAGASALPQNSLTFAGERGPANFDVRHRIAANYIFDLSSWGTHGDFTHAIFNGLEFAGTTTFQTGQPFTVNSIFDVNLDGNLTDRPNTTAGIQETGNRAQPLILTVNPATLLAPIGTDGAVPRNSFRSGNLFVTNAAVIKTFSFSEQTKLVFRTEAFNLFNRANYGIPVRFLEAPGFGRATDTLTPGRRIQFGLKVLF